MAKGLNDIDVRVGKEIDIINIKKNLIENYSKEIDNIKIIIENLIINNRFDRLEECPVCRAKIDHKNSTEETSIYGLKYIRCELCKHIFTQLVLKKDAMQEFFSSNENLSSVYTDKKILDKRIEEIYKPKLEYIIKSFCKIHNRYPKSILDVGAGAGHFVYAAKNHGLESTGIEINKQSIDFSRKNFGIELINIDFNTEWENFSNYDIITFWGVIEYLLNPNPFLSNAHKIIKGSKGMIFCEVPRYESMSTNILNVYSNSAVRHFTPWCRISCFTDSSLNTLFFNNNIQPTNAWYFGLDAYELFTQIAYNQKDISILKLMKNHIPAIQESIDNSQLSDSIILGGIVN